MALPPPLLILPAARLWKERHAHRYLSLAETADGEIWVLLKDLRQWTPRLLGDNDLAHRYPHAIARCDETRRAYIRADVMVRVLNGFKDTAVLKLLDWMERCVLGPARRRAELAPSDSRYQVQSPHHLPPSEEDHNPSFWASCQILVRPSQWDPRVWRIGWGSYGLRRTLLIGLAGTVVVLVASALVDSLSWDVERAYLPWTWLAIALVIWAGLWNLAWLIGGLRSAVRRNLEGLSLPLAATGALANALLAMWCFNQVLVTLALSLSSFWSYYVEGDPPMQAVVLPGSIALATPPMLAVSGPVGVGTTRAVKAALDAHPDIRRVVLESPGGLVIEGMGLAKVVKRRQLETVVLSRCVSACTLVYVAGSKRWLGADGQLGFHRSHLPGEAFSLMPNETDRAIGEWYAENGLSERFIQNALVTPAYQMWYPDSDLLMDEGVATGVWEPKGSSLRVE